MYRIDAFDYLFIPIASFPCLCILAITSIDGNYIPMFSLMNLFLLDLRLNNKHVIGLSIVKFEYTNKYLNINAVIITYSLIKSSTNYFKHSAIVFEGEIWILDWSLYNIVCYSIETNETIIYALFSSILNYKSFYCILKFPFTVTWLSTC